MLKNNTSWKVSTPPENTFNDIYQYLSIIALQFDRALILIQKSKISSTMVSNFKLNLFHILQFLYSNMNICPVDPTLKKPPFHNQHTYYSPFSLHWSLWFTSSSYAGTVTPGLRLYLTRDPGEFVEMAVKYT